MALGSAAAIDRAARQIVTTGAAMDLRVEDGRLIATPIRDVPRKGWAEAAALVAAAEEDPDETAWTAFGNDGDDASTW